MQWQHSDWVTLGQSLRVTAVWPQRASEQYPAMKGSPVTAVPLPQDNEDRSSTAGREL